MVEQPLTFVNDKKKKLDDLTENSLTSLTELNAQKEKVR